MGANISCKWYNNGWEILPELGLDKIYVCFIDAVMYNIYSCMPCPNHQIPHVVGKLQGPRQWTSLQVVSSCRRWHKTCHCVHWVVMDVDFHYFVGNTWQFSLRYIGIWNLLMWSLVCFYLLWMMGLCIPIAFESCCFISCFLSYERN